MNIIFHYWCWNSFTSCVYRKVIKIANSINMLFSWHFLFIMSSTYNDIKYNIILGTKVTRLWCRVLYTFNTNPNPKSQFILKYHFKIILNINIGLKIVISHSSKSIKWEGNFFSRSILLFSLFMTDLLILDNRKIIIPNTNNDIYTIRYLNLKNYKFKK